MGMGLTGRTLGVIGLGNIGSDMIKLAAPFGDAPPDVRSLGAPAQATAAEIGVELTDLETLLRDGRYRVGQLPAERPRRTT